MTTQNESLKRLTVIESSLTPCPYNRLWLVQIPQDGWDRFECIVDDSGLRSPELPGPLETPENGVEFVRKGSANYTAEQLQAAYDRAHADVRKEYAEDLPRILADAGVKTVEELAWQCQKYEQLLRSVRHLAKRSPNMEISDSLLSQIEAVLQPKEPTP